MQFLQTSAQPPSSNNLIEEIDSKCGGYKLSIQFAMTCDAIAILHRVTNSPAAQFRLEHSRWCQLSRPHPANQRRVHGGCLSLPSSSWIIQIVQTPSVFFFLPSFLPATARVCVSAMSQREDPPFNLLRDTNKSDRTEEKLKALQHVFSSNLSPPPTLLPLPFLPNAPEWTLLACQWTLLLSQIYRCSAYERS